MPSIDTANSRAGFAAANLANIKKLPIELKPQELTAEMVAGLDRMLVQKNTRPVGPPDNDASNVYAEIKVGGKTVAKVYNSGAAEGPNRIAGLKLDDGQGPSLAQRRAEQIAEFLGGTVVKAPTAITQQQWNARPPRQFQVDEAQLALDREKFFAARWQRLDLNANTDPGLLLAAQEA